MDGGVLAYIIQQITYLQLVHQPFACSSKLRNQIKSVCRSLPGDYGWDPLGLADPTMQDQDDAVMNLKWLSYAELVHGRWAMLAAAGAIAPELMAKLGWIPQATGLPWFEAGGLFSKAGR